jgi:hypothetical protein
LRSDNGELALEGVVNLPVWKTRLVSEETRGRERGRRGVGLNYARPQLRSANQVNNLKLVKYFVLDPRTRKTEGEKTGTFLYC